MKSILGISVNRKAKSFVFEGFIRSSVVFNQVMKAMQSLPVLMF